jgi:hypothetical protein
MSKKDKEEVNNDKRILMRRLSQGEISEKDLQGLLKKLPDVSDNAEEVNLNDNDK